MLLRLPPLHVLPLFALVLFVVLVWHSTRLHAVELGRWTCRMSWMSPSYLHIDGLNTSVTPLASKYKLFLYREVGWDGDQTPDGVPVLYLPGNAGSMMQARSIASSAARQYWSAPFVRDESMYERGIRPLDVFTVDFNEDFSAFHGPTLLSQSLFTTHCIDHILSLYAHLPEHQRPTSVLLLGHSMGGIVARHSLTLLQDPSTVHTLVTLSTPHRLPPVTSDHLIDRVYSEIADYWSAANLLDRTHPVSTMVLVSICGGSPDPTLASDACALSWDDVPSSHGLGMFTSGMVGTWTGVDHEAMVWCHQVRWRVARALLELGGVARMGGEQAERMQVAREWIGGEPPALSAGDQGKESIGIDLDKTDHTRLETTARLTHPSSTRHHYLFTIPSAPKPSTFRLISDFTINRIGRHSSSTAQVYHCQAPSLSAESLLSCVRLDPARLDLLPSSPLAGTPFRPNEGVDETEGMTFFEAEIPPSKAEGWIVVAVDGQGWAVGELLSQGQGLTVVQSEGMWSLLFGGVTLPTLSGSSSLLSRIHLPNAVSHSLLVYRIEIDQQSTCPKQPAFLPLLSHQTVTAPPAVSPTTQEQSFYPNPSSHHLQSHSASAPFMPLRADEGFILEMWFDPTAGCEPGPPARLRLDPVASLAKLALRYRMTAVAWGNGVVALVLARQIGTFRTTGIFPPFQEALSQEVRASGISLPFALVGCSLLNSEVIRILACPFPRVSAFFAGLLLGNHHFIFLPLSAIFVAAAAGLVSALLGAQRGMLALGEWGLDLVDRKGSMLKLSSPSDPRPPFRRREIIPLVLLLALVATFVPYQLAFLVSYLIHSLSTLSALRSSFSPSRSNLYASVLYLLLWLLPVNAPVLVVWVRNLQANWTEPFGGDHNVLDVAGVLVLIEMCSGGRSLEEGGRGRKRVKALQVSFYVLAWSSFVFGSRYIHRIYDLANVSLCLLVACLVGGGSIS